MQRQRVSNPDLDLRALCGCLGFHLPAKTSNNRGCHATLCLVRQSRLENPCSRLKTKCMEKRKREGGTERERERERERKRERERESDTQRDRERHIET